MTYEEKRNCSTVFEGILRHKLGYSFKIRPNPDPDPKKAANEQAAYGLRKVDERTK